jgi:hypothetical protein
MTSNSSPDVAASQSQIPWRKWVEPWYFSYALLGVMLAGLAPILLPLAVSRSGSPAEVGLVMPAFNLGGLASPLWGGLADRYRLLLVGMFEDIQAEYIHQWQLWQKSLQDLQNTTDIYRTSTIVLYTHEAKNIPGGLIASLSIP